MKKALKFVFILSLVFSLAGGLSSCKSLRLDRASRTERKAIRATERQQQKGNKAFTKQYDKKYKRQTKIQNEQQREMIKQSRKRPKNMGKPKSRFFLFRWLGI